MISRTSDSVLQTLRGMWLTFFLGIPGFFINMFDKPIGDAIKWAAKQFAQLPGFVGKVMMAVLRTILGFAKAIWQALSDALNPWQRHSPSLVDLVSSGVDVILAKYESLRKIDIGAGWRKAASDIQKFNNDAKGSINAGEDNKVNANVMKVAQNNPAALGSAQAVASDIKVLRTDLEAVTAAYAKQLLVVNQWQRALDAATEKLKQQQFILNQEQYKLNQISKALDHEKSALDNWASTPIKGMKAADDAATEVSTRGRFSDVAFRAIRRLARTMIGGGISLFAS